MWGCGCNRRLVGRLACSNGRGSWSLAGRGHSLCAEEAKAIQPSEPTSTSLCPPPLPFTEEGDFTTAYSYYYEAYEQYAALSSPRALPLLKLMLLAKVLMRAWSWERGTVGTLLACLDREAEACC